MMLDSGVECFRRVVEAFSRDWLIHQSVDATESLSHDAQADEMSWQESHTFVDVG